MKEWKNVKGYEGSYQISDLGEVRSLDRKVKWKDTERTIKGRILKPTPNSNGYPIVTLSGKNYKLHKLVALHFLNHPINDNSYVVDHIDNNKLNNRVDNLQYIPFRQNTSKDKWRKGKTSKYTGVSWNTNRKKWIAQIHINGQHKNLGRFNCELKAHLAYQTALKQVSPTN